MLIDSPGVTTGASDDLSRRHLTVTLTSTSCRWSSMPPINSTSNLLMTNKAQKRRLKANYLHTLKVGTKREIKLESSQSPHTFAKAMLFAKWQHHLRFCSGLPYAPLKAMVTKISKWSRIQNSFRITPKTESLVDFAIPDMPSKFQKDPSRTFWVILLTHRQTNKQTNKVWQKHNLLGRGNETK